MSCQTKIACEFPKWISMRLMLLLLLCFPAVIFSNIADSTPVVVAQQEHAKLTTVIDSTTKETSDIQTTTHGKKFSGKVAFYGLKAHGRKTASGEIHNAYALIAAHKTLPLGTLVRIYNGTRSVVVKINDRGPFTKGFVLDVSWAAAKELGILSSGTAKISAEVIGFKKIHIK